MKHVFTVFFVSVVLCTSLSSQPVLDRSGRGVQGIVESYRSAEISPEISGRIVQICIPEGSVAGKGDTILKIEYMESFLHAERARIISENDADAKAANLKLDMAKLEYEAMKMVYDSTGAVSEEVLWGRKYEYDVAAAESEQIMIQKSREKVEYKIAEERLRAHFIIAPYRCVVANIELKEWEHCRVGEPLVSVVDARQCIFVTYVPISMTRELKVGKKVNLEIDSKGGLVKRTGKVKFISPVVDPASDLLTIRIVFDNRDGSVKPGVSGYLNIR